MAVAGAGAWSCALITAQPPSARRGSARFLEGLTLLLEQQVGPFPFPPSGTAIGLQEDLAALSQAYQDEAEANVCSKEATVGELQRQRIWTSSLPRAPRAGASIPVLGLQRDCMQGEPLRRGCLSGAPCRAPGVPRPPGRAQQRAARARGTQGMLSWPGLAWRALEELALY